MPFANYSDLQASILDWMGAWPWYLVGADLLGMVIFWLLWVPFGRSTAEAG